MCDDLKQNMRQILLLFVMRDDLKQNTAQILLLFVRCDGLKQNLSGIVLESGWANGSNARAHFCSSQFYSNGAMRQSESWRKCSSERMPAV